jgi:hypothetical protein
MASVTLILTRTPVHEFVYSSRGNVEADTMTDEARALLSLQNPAAQ